MTNNQNDDKNLHIINFGCRLNAYESEVMKEVLSSQNKEKIAIFNTCAVTQEAERQSRQKIRQVKNEMPDAKIVVTGCAAQINPEKYKQMPEVDIVFGNTKKTNQEFLSKISDHIKIAKEDETKKVLVDNIMQEKKLDKEVGITHFEDKTRAFVQIQNGCNHRCTFCIIPYGRGNSRSVSQAQVFSEIENLIENGYNEVVLTGVDLTSYGQDLDHDIGLGKLVKNILRQFPSLKRLRLSSVDVAEVDKDLVDTIANDSRMMPYLHLSLQSGDDEILKLMKRRHTRQMAIDFCNKMRSLRPDITFGSDIITGFPSETEEMFLNTKKMLEDANIIFNHVFSFSPRSGTLAAIMKGQVEKSVKKTRTASLIEQTRQQKLALMKTMVNSTHSGLIESDMVARLENFLQVKIINPSADDKIEGKILSIKILTLEDDELLGEVVP